MGYVLQWMWLQGMRAEVDDSKNFLEVGWSAEVDNGEFSQETVGSVVRGVDLETFFKDAK